MATIQGSGSVLRNCQHANFTCTAEAMETGAHETGRFRFSNFYCPDCDQHIELMGPNGPVPFVDLMGMERSKAKDRVLVKMQTAPAAPTVAPKVRTNDERRADAEAKIVSDIGGDGPGTRLALGFFRKGYHASCQACVELAKKMNAWGGPGCRERLDNEIVPDIMPRARQWVANTHKIASGVLGLVGAVVDVETPLLQAGIRKAVIEAIDEWDASQKGTDQ